MRDRFHAPAGDAVIVGCAGGDGSVRIGGRTSGDHAGVVGVAGEEVVGIFVQRRVDDGRFSAVEGVIEFIGGAGEDLILR